ncbi:complex I intermediate-associated protein 30 [Diplocarpon mali]|nr:complex I intermediate-associated protein 30 [Diplocarpon mali]
MPRSLILLLLGRVATAATLPLFQPWNASTWTASDDSVRPGGLSTSALEVLAPGTSDNPFSAPIIKFSGTLNSAALNGSGFASQRTVDEWPGVDLSCYSGLIIEIPYTDGKTYTLNFRDTVPPRVNGVEQASVSWDYDFQIPATGTSAPAGKYKQFVFRFEDLVPTYRGSVQNDTAPLNLTSIKRVNFMIRSFFGRDQQEGDFELRIRSVLATT